MASIPEALTIALQRHQAGQLQAAEQAYRRILAVEPNQPDARHLLGVIAHQVGKHDVAIQYIAAAIQLCGDQAAFYVSLGNAYRALQQFAEAISCYQKALQLRPLDPETLFNLGNALREHGQGDSAVVYYRRALELKPDYAEAQNNLGCVLEGQGKLAEAIACYRQVTELRPNDVQPHYNLGVALKKRGELVQANTCFRRALQLNPNDVDVYASLGSTLEAQGKLQDAVACYCRALQLQPDHVDSLNNLGVALAQQGKLSEAIDSYRRALQLKPDHAEVHNNLGTVLQEQRKLAEAIACYRRALELKANFVEAHTSLGIVFETLGDLQGEVSFRAALRHNSRFAIAHLKLAELLGGRLPEEDFAALHRLLGLGGGSNGHGPGDSDPDSVSGMEDPLPDAERLLLHFGVARVLDARGGYVQAAWHLDRGNALQLAEWRKRGLQYAPQEHELFVTRMISVCTPDFFAGVRGFGLSSEVPVFVVGLPRSGTTLVEQILASHSQFYGAGELKLASAAMSALSAPGVDAFEALRRLDHQTAERLASRYLEGLREFDDKALRIVDKMPENYLFLGLLASLFPRAKFIHCRRDLRDVAASCWMTHFAETRWANNQEHIVSCFRQHQRLMEHWRKVLPVPLLEVDYEETVANLEGVARRLVAWCGLGWEPACLEFYHGKGVVGTASAVQVRKPIYRTSVGRWKHYEHALATLLSAIPGG